MKSRESLTSRRKAAVLRLILLFALVLLAPVGRAAAGPAGKAAQPTTPPFHPGDLETFFNALMEQHLAAYGIPGAAVAVVNTEGVLFTKGYGLADNEQNRPVEAEKTLFRIGSITKLFTWTAVMQLVEQGRLDLNTDVNQYLKGMQASAYDGQPITLLHLMDHTAGFEDRGIGTMARSREQAQPLDAYLAKHLPARVRPPGLVSSYSNQGAALAGLIVAQTAGVPYEQYIAEQILAPLGMMHTTAQQPPDEPLRDELAKSYICRGESCREQPFLYDLLTPAGSMYASAGDMARFMVMHLRDGEYEGARVLQTATAQEMHRQSFTHHPQIPGWAHGWQENVINGQRLLWHDGSFQGYVSLLALLPERGVGLFVVYNSPGGGAAVDESLQGFMDRYFPVEPTPRAESTPVDSKPLEGNYQPVRRPYTTIERLTRNTLTVPLIAWPGGPVEFLGRVWQPVGPSLYQTNEGEWLTFRPDARGQTRYAAVGNLAFEKLAPLDAPTVQLGLAGGCLAILLLAVIGWPLTAGERRRRQMPPPLPARRALWVAGLAALFALCVVGALVGVVSTTTELRFGVPPALSAVSAAALLLIPLAIAVAGLAGLAWARRYYSFAMRLHYGLIALALVGLVWLLNYWNVLGFRFG